MRQTLFILLLSCIAALGQPATTVDTIADLVARKPRTNSTEVVYVKGRLAAGDFKMEPQAFRYDPTSVESTNDICLMPSTGVGRWINEWKGDARIFGAIPYSAPSTLVPWGFKTNIAAIGSGPFSVWIRAKLPSSFTDPVGMFGIGPSLTDPDIGTAFTASSLGFRASSSVFGFLFRSTNASSATGSSVWEAASLDATPSTFSAYLGTTVDIVLTRSGTVPKVYFNGTDVTASFTLANANGWSKSLGMGATLQAYVGNNDNMWYWPEATSRFAVWASALTAGQAADPENTGSKVVDFTSYTTNVPTDAGPGINLALAYASSRGGGTVRLRDGCYRISTPIRMRRNTTLEGDGVAFYPKTQFDVEGFTPGGTTLVPWFGHEGDVVQTLRADLAPGEVYFYLRPGGGVVSYTNATGYVYTKSARTTVKNLAIFGGLAKYGRSFYADRAGSLNYEGVASIGMPGYALYVVQPNSLFIHGFSATGGLGAYLNGVADSDVSQYFHDGPQGPAFRIYGNLNNFANMVPEFAYVSRSGTSAFELSTTVNASTDMFTSSADHKRQTGDVVRFVTDTGTLPTPLRSDVDYFVYRVSATTFKVSYKYSDDISHDGVMDGSGFLDITDVGSGTWYVSPGPAVGLLVQGDNNGFSNIRSQRNSLEGLRLENARENTFGQSRFMLAGYGNTSLSNVANVQLINSQTNTFIGMTVTDRNTAGFATNGVIGDSLSVGNYFSGVLTYTTSPNWIDKRIAVQNRWSDSKGEIFNADSSRASVLLPSVSGFSAYADERATNNAKPVVYDTSSRRFMISRDSTSGNWDYMWTHPFAGPIFWNSLTANGAMQGANAGTAATLSYLHGESFQPLLSIRSYSTSGASYAGAPLIGLQRYRSGTFGSYAALEKTNYLGGIQFGGMFSNTINHFSIGDAGVYAKATENWETGKRGTKIEFQATQTGTGTPSIGLIVKSDGRINLPFQSSAPAVDLEDGDAFYGVNGGTTNLWVRRAGAWVGALP